MQQIFRSKREKKISAWNLTSVSHVTDEDSKHYYTTEEGFLFKLNKQDIGESYDVVEMKNKKTPLKLDLDLDLKFWKKNNVY